jgi:hypothetical protein
LEAASDAVSATDDAALPTRSVAVDAALLIRSVAVDAVSLALPITRSRNEVIARRVRLTLRCTILPGVTFSVSRSTSVLRFRWVRSISRRSWSGSSVVMVFLTVP